MDFSQNNYLLTIFIPTYNRANYLHDTLAMFKRYISELDMEKIIQIIVGNNNSNDHTADVISSFEYSEFTGYNNYENIGITQNILKGLTLSAGKYLWIYGDDDDVHANVFKGIINDLKEGKTQLIKLQSQTCPNPSIFKTVTGEKSYQTYCLSRETFDKKNFSREERKAGFITSLIYNRNILENVLSEFYKSSDYNDSYKMNNYFCKTFTLLYFDKVKAYLRSTKVTIAARAFEGGSHFLKDSDIYFKTFFLDELECYEYYKSSHADLYRLSINSYYNKSNILYNLKMYNCFDKRVIKRYFENLNLLDVTVALKYLLLMCVPRFLVILRFKSLPKLKSCIVKA